MKSLLFVLVALLGAAATWSFPMTSINVPRQCADPTFACQDLESARLCGVVKSCIHDIWSTMSAPDDNDEICDLCKEMVKEARDQLLSNMTQEEIKEVFEGSCKLLPVKLIADACIKLVDEFIPELVEMLASRMDPNMVCTVAGLCNLVHLPIIRPVENNVMVRDDLVCEFCTHVLEHIKELVTANTTVEEFRTALLNFCKHTGSFSSRCTDLVNEYYDSIFDYIRNLDTKGFCTLMTLCKNGHISVAKKIMPSQKLLPALKLIPAQPMDDGKVFKAAKIQPAISSAKSLSHSLETNEIFESSSQQLPAERFSHPLITFERDTECAFCRAISFFLKNDLSGGRNEENVEKALREVCVKWVYEYPDHCKAFVNKFSKELKQHIVKGTEFDDLCITMRVCSVEGKENDLKVRVIHPKDSGPLCDLCKEVCSQIEGQLKDPTTKANTEEFLDQLCNYLPKSVQDDCKTLVKQNLDVIFNILEKELQGDSACPALGLCPGHVQKPTSKRIKTIECDLCKDFVEQLQKRLQDPDVKQSLRDLLDRGCSKLPTEIANECKNFVDQNIDNLVNILVQDMDPNVVCSALRLCDGAVKVRPPKFNDLECDLCKEVVQKVDDELKDQRTEEEIRKALDKVCSYLPSSMSAKCEKFVDEYSQLLITLLAEEMDPNLICAAIKLCPEDLEKMKEWKAKEKNLECQGCQYLFHFIQNQLMNSNVQEAIKADLRKVCKLLPSNFSENCIAYIDEFGSSLLVIVAQYLDPSTVCYGLHACSSVNTSDTHSFSSTSVKKLELDECSLCTTVVDYLDKLLEEDDVDKEITQLAEKVCNVIPSSLKDKCTILIQTYGPYLLQMIGQLADSKQVCQAIDMCPRSAGHVHLVGGQKCTFGPSYWCRSKVHAVACKAEKYCAENEWRK